MTMAKVFLSITGLLFLPYGLYCVVEPGILTQYTGMGLSDNTAKIEVRAMYGGLQAAMGLFFLVCVANKDLTRPGLLVAVFCLGGLATARTFGLLVDGGDNGYNTAAVVYEGVSTVLALWAYKHTGKVA